MRLFPRPTTSPKVRVDHDISLLIPEVWCRMTPAERQPHFLIDNGYFEKCEDFDFNGARCWPAVWATA